MCRAQVALSERSIRGGIRHVPLENIGCPTCIGLSSSEDETGHVNRRRYNEILSNELSMLFGAAQNKEAEKMLHERLVNICLVKSIIAIESIR